MAKSKSRNLSCPKCDGPLVVEHRHEMIETDMGSCPTVFAAQATCPACGRKVSAHLFGLGPSPVAAQAAMERRVEEARG